MTTEKILSTSVRFPKEELPASINTEDLPNWIQENEITYNDETKKCTIKRLNGVSAGAADTPVYMDADGQPRPITGFSSSLLDYVDTELDLTRRIKNSQVKVFAEESPFIEVEESLDEQEIRNYEIKESLSDFIAYNEQQGVSILNNFILNKIDVETIPTYHEEEIEVETVVPFGPVTLFSGTAIDFYNSQDRSFTVPEQINWEEMYLILSRVDNNNNILQSKVYNYENTLLAPQPGSEYMPNMENPEPGGTWGFNPWSSSGGMTAAVEVHAYDLTWNNQNQTSTIDYFDIPNYLNYVGVHNDDDLIRLVLHYNNTDSKVGTVTTTQMVEGDPIVTSDSLSLSLGKGLLANTGGQLVIGRYNILENSPFIIGNGVDSENRNNLFEIKTNGDVVVTGKIINGEGIEQGTIYEGNEPPSEDSGAVFWISD